tara:strand:+ start:197 stop:820 length:624 start_codon:yes stop_codon:yes gene_type:complete
MDYRGRTTEIGASWQTPRTRHAFTAIENGKAGFVLDGAMIGSTPGDDQGAAIPFQSAQAFGIDVPPLGFSLPIKILGYQPPGSTLPTTMPTDPKYYQAQPEGNASYASFDPGIYYAPQTKNGSQLDPSGKSGKTPVFYGGGALPNQTLDDLSQMQPRPPVGPTPAQMAMVDEMAKNAQADANKADKIKKAWILAGAGVAIYWIFFRG